MANRLREIEAFVRTAESGSLSRAGRELGLSQPSISRLVAGLEARLGVALLARTTRRITVTDAGAAFLLRVRDVLDGLEEAEAAVLGAGGLRGSLRAIMPGAFGAREIIPRLAGFLDMNPSLTVDLLMSDRLDDLVEEGADLAIRIGPLGDSRLLARRLASAPRMAVASPAYLAARGEPGSPTDLVAHDCIFGPGGSAREAWSFHRGPIAFSVPIAGRVRAASAEGVVACAKAHLGIAVASLWMCREELASGVLRPILTDYPLAPVDVHAVFPAGRRPAAKARAFADYLARQIT